MNNSTGTKVFIPIIYLSLIVGVNYGFAHTVPFETPWGMLPPMTFIVGIVFVLRDYVQRVIGHRVILIMVIGCVLSWWLANPFVAKASLVAFSASELSDWFVYSVVKKEFHYKVLYSSIAGVLIDTIIFLPMIGALSLSAVTIMFASKMIAAVSVFYYYRGTK